MSIPIVGEDRTIVGWTDTIPHIIGASLRHAEAEKLLGGRIVAIYIEVENPLDAAKAGAPKDWRGVWRCLALCSESIVAGDPSDYPVSTVRLKEGREKRK
jgi:hypothetical protein